MPKISEVPRSHVGNYLKSIVDGNAEKENDESVIIDYSIASLLIASLLLYGSAQSLQILRPEAGALISAPLVQGGAGSERELCLQDCRDAYGEWIGSYSNYAYARCAQGCESRFWHEFDRSMRELEKEGKAMK